LKWNRFLELETKLYAEKMKYEKKCIYEERNQFNEIFYYAAERITEKDVNFTNL
jgi:hypothetical protein